MFTHADILAQAWQVEGLPGVSERGFVGEALQMIDAWQEQPPEGVAAGLPASRRHLAAIGYERADDSIFYPAFTAWVLQEVEGWMLPGEQILSGRIRERIQAHYPNYRSVPGLDSYAFYQTRRPALGGGEEVYKRWFPFGERFSRSEFFRPPDDPDDTALIYLTGHHTEAQREWLRTEKLPAHANLAPGRRPVATSRPEWASLKAYTTFFARDMPQAFDVCVMANVMSWVLRQGKPLRPEDEATLEILSQVITDRLYMTDGYRIAPYYTDPASIAYVLGRLVGYGSHPWCEAHRMPLVEGIRELLAHRAQSLGTIQRMVLASSLALCGQARGLVTPGVGRLEADEVVSFSLYRFPLGAEYPLWLAQRLAPRPWLQVRFSSPAFSLALAIESAVLLRR